MYTLPRRTHDPAHLKQNKSPTVRAWISYDLQHSFLDGFLYIIIITVHSTGGLGIQPPLHLAYDWLTIIITSFQ